MIAFGYGDYPGLQTQKLLSVSVTPLCSPALLASGVVLREPADVLRHVLVQDNSDGPQGQAAFWDIWLDAAGVRREGLPVGPRFTDSALALEAAMAGAGIVAGLPELAAADIAAGRLVAPFDLAVPLATGYHVVSNVLASKRGAVDIFRSWLEQEAAASLR